MAEFIIERGKSTTDPQAVQKLVPFDTSTGKYVHLGGQVASERNPGTANQYGVGVPECEYTSWAHGDGDTIVTSNPAILFGVFINVALTGDAAIRDGTTAGGTLLLTTGATVNTYYEFPGLLCDSGLFIDDNASAGNILVFYRDQ